jgi:translation initiation factor IF-2
MPSNQDKNLIIRPPVVVIMGHIDHGKSTLLDYIRKTKVVEGEAGGITQHVGAYQAIYTSADGIQHPITFLDTPGHAAFCNIRERGAQSADIAILIVSAEDGVKPQTVEAYKNIKDAKIPFLVAITKTDKPNANIEKTKTSLGENEIYVEGWGGDVSCIPISSITGEGISELLEMIILMAEMANLTTNPEVNAHGVVVESTLDTRKGISATLLVKDGTIREGTFIVAEGSYSPVRFIENFKGEKIKSATASMPAKILGWNTIPACGALFVTVGSKKVAEEMIEIWNEKQKKIMSDFDKTTKKAPVKTEGLENKEESDKPETVIIPIIIKADVIGSLEGVKHELAKIHHDNVSLSIISSGIGDINENDVKMATSDPRTIIVGFNVKPDKKTSAMIDRSPIPLNVKTFSIIYELSEFLNQAVIEKIPKVYIEEVSGCAKILAIFSKEKDKQVVGGKVESGTIGNGNEVRIMRRGTEIGRGKIRELQSKKIKVSEVALGFEFGMMVEAKMEIAVGDRVEAVRTVEVRGER